MRKAIRAAWSSFSRDLHEDKTGMDYVLKRADSNKNGAMTEVKP